MDWTGLAAAKQRSRADAAATAHGDNGMLFVGSFEFVNGFREEDGAGTAEGMAEGAADAAPTGSQSLLAACGAPVTIPSSAPAQPILKTRHRPLVAAMKSGSGVQLTYGKAEKGLSFQPAILPVLPRLLYRRGEVSYMEAECSRSGLLKTYRLDRIHRVAPLR